ncbi:MFS transporter [Kribbella qitaiheensis]|uniref:MFS transporter n=1 Tax=Kribbella qitaiheensis TaxID=1544730 RepID=A0A7G6X0G3_9ACTN|nr:MFS transporter [Kribbella qitaiheensis]QNE19728.1 MFS transporter [Kribbella qitaiheensis]
MTATAELPADQQEPAIDQRGAGRLPGVLAPQYRALTIGMVALTVLVAFEALAVATAMPTVAQALNGLPLYALAFGGPLASGVVGMVVSGTWSDLKGPTRPLWHGTGWFLAGLLIAGLAPSMEVLVIGRFVQGFGAGLLTVAMYVVVGHLYPARLRPKIFAAFATGWVVPSLVGPVIAGLIVEHSSWRIVFLAVPAMAIPAALVMRPGLAHAGTVTEQRDQRIWGKQAVWAVVAAVGVGVLSYGGQQHGVLQVALLIAGLAGVVAFAPKLLPSGTFKLASGLPSVIALRGLVAASGFGAEVFLPLMLTRERGLSPTYAGLVLTVSALSWTAASWYRGRPKQPFSHAVFLQAGMVSIVLGIVTATLTLNPNVPVLVGVLGWSLTGLGMGTVFPTVSVLVLEYSSREEQGANSSALSLSDSLATATVLAIGGSVFAVIEPHWPIAAYLTAFGLPALIALVGVLAARRTAR